MKIINIQKIQSISNINLKMKIILSVFIVGGAIFSWKNFDFVVSDILMMVFFAIFLLWNIPGKISAILALGCLISCPILVIAEKDKLAETMAVQAYLFLTMTVILQVVELKRKKEVGEMKEISEVKEKILNKKNNIILWAVSFSKKALKILVPISVAFLVSSLVLLAFSQKKLAEIFYSWMLFVFGLIALALIVKVFAQNKIKK